MSAADDMKRRATRAALTGALLETFDSPSERKEFALRMWEHGIISEQAAELLIEVYGLEAAE